jgi:hypothetical protein
MMVRVSCIPGETPAHWCARATGDYVAARTAFQIEWGRLSAVDVSLLSVGYPTLDDGYDGAMDALEEADNERCEAKTELDRESTIAFRAAPRVKWKRGGRSGIYPE